MRFNIAKKFYNYFLKSIININFFYKFIKFLKL